MKPASLLATIAMMTSLFSAPVRAENLPADNCQIFIKSVGVSYSSHSMAGIPVTVKVGWIGNGEFIQRVGFYGYSTTRDLGNAPDCHMGADPRDGQWRIIDAMNGGYSGYGTSGSEYGEYSFSFLIHSGSVLGQCPGFHYGFVGTFFVQTNVNTYWLNPDIDSSKHFHFDDNGLRTLQNQGASPGMLSTVRDDLRYYNPLRCQ